MIYSRTRDIDVALIQDLRRSVGWDTDEAVMWEDALACALEVASAWDGNLLVGVGFLVGSNRHAVLCDLTVRASHQRRDIGRRIVEELLVAVDKRHIRYVTLTFDEHKPWLKSFYEACGFEEISNAMRLKR